MEKLTATLLFFIAMQFPYIVSDAQQAENGGGTQADHVCQNQPLRT